MSQLYELQENDYVSGFGYFIAYGEVLGQQVAYFQNRGHRRAYVLSTGEVV